MTQDEAQHLIACVKQLQDSYPALTEKERAIAFIEGATLDDCEDISSAIVDRMDFLTRPKCF